MYYEYESGKKRIMLSIQLTITNTYKELHDLYRPYTWDGEIKDIMIN
jgi:hypothetical protein